jgi:hypothetical protein
MVNVSTIKKKLDRRKNTKNFVPVIIRFCFPSSFSSLFFGHSLDHNWALLKSPARQFLRIFTIMTHVRVKMVRNYVYVSSIMSIKINLLYEFWTLNLLSIFFCRNKSTANPSPGDNMFFHSQQIITYMSDAKHVIT